MTDPTQIAAKLSKAQRLCLNDLSLYGVRAFRPGSNLHADVFYPDTNGQQRWICTDLDALHRMGVARADDCEPRPLSEPHREIGPLEADHLWTLTDLGKDVLRAVRSEKRGQAVRSALIAEREGVHG